MLRRWAWTAARPSPPNAREIRNANRGVEPWVGPSPLVLVGGGVGLDVSPWNDWNGVAQGFSVETAVRILKVVHGSTDLVGVGVGVGVTVGVAVSPWNDWNGVSVGVAVGVGVGVADSVGVGVGVGVSVGVGVGESVGVGVGEDRKSVV